MDRDEFLSYIKSGKLSLNIATRLFSRVLCNRA